MFTCVQSRWKNSKTVEIQIQTCLLEKEKKILVQTEITPLRKRRWWGGWCNQGGGLMSISSVGRGKKASVVSQLLNLKILFVCNYSSRFLVVLSDQPWTRMEQINYICSPITFISVHFPLLMTLTENCRRDFSSIIE